MADLTTLLEKRKAYIKAKAEYFANFMVEHNLTTDTLATCNARNWDVELHNAMPEIGCELLKMGIRTTSSVNWGVTDWVFTIKTS
jgi:hypothetical protein